MGGGEKQKEEMRGQAADEAQEKMEKVGRGEGRKAKGNRK